MTTIGINLISCKSSNLVGTWKYVKRHLMEMKNMDLSDFKFIFYIPKNIDPSVFLIPPNCNHEIIYTWSIDNILLKHIYVQTIFYFKLKKCDVFYSPDSNFPWLGKSKKIITILDMYWYTHKQMYPWLKRNVGFLLTKVAVNKADKIITISESSKNDIIKLFKGVEDKVIINYCFIPNDEIVSIPLQFKGNNNNRYFLSVSSLQPIKNYEGLLEAFALLMNKYPYKLYIVGGSINNSYSNQLYALVHKYNLNTNVIFTGYISENELNKLYEGCLGIIMPSFYEGFGYAPLEGFYRNKPCVVSNVSSLPEVVGKAGVYVDPYNVQSICDGMEELILNDKKYIQNIPEQIEKFNSKKLTQTFLKILTN